MHLSQHFRLLGVCSGVPHPNFFLEAKAAKGDADTAKQQACYNAALGARAMHKLQSYDESVHDGNAYIFSSTCHGDQLKLYTTHLAAATDTNSKSPYHMTLIDTPSLTGNADSFRR